MKTFKIVCIFICFSATIGGVLNFFRDLQIEDLFMAVIMAVVGIVLFNNVRKQEDKQRKNISAATLTNEKIKKTPEKATVPKKTIKEGFSDFKSEVKTASSSVSDKYISKDGTLRFTNNFQSVWIEPDGLDLDGEIIATSPDKNYFFMHGTYELKRSDDYAEAIALVTKEQKLYHKKTDGAGIEACIVSNDGTVIYYDDECYLHIVSLDGKQTKEEFPIRYDEKYCSIDFDYCYAYDFASELWVYDVSKKKVTMHNLPEDWYEIDYASREGTLISICAKGKTVVFDLMSKSFQ